MTRSRFVSILAVASIAAACAGGATATTTSSATTTVGSSTTTVAVTTTTAAPGFTVTSEDGDLTVFVPTAAMAEDPGITLSVLDPEDYPPELAGAAETPGAKIYAAGPDGLVFDAPVTITRRFDAANFDLAPNEMPIIVLLTRSDDGVYELYGDLQVLRDGPDVFVSGTTTHFSPIVAIRESSTVSVNLSQDALTATPSARSIGDILKLATEAGGTIGITADFHDAEGKPLMAPVDSGWLAIDGDGIDSGLNGSSATITSEDIGAIDIALRYAGEFGGFRVAGSVGFTTVPELVDGFSSVRMTFTLSGKVQFYDPDTSLLGRTLAGFEIASDHVDGIAWVPRGDFLGGNSASYSWMNPLGGFGNLYGGLIQDTNNNGQVDDGDGMFAPYAYGDEAGMFGFVAPLYVYANYFVYLLDGDQYATLPETWDGSIDVSDAAARFASEYTGMGRFESSLGVVGMTDGNPFVYMVDPSEEKQSAPDLEVLMIPGLRIRF